MKPAKAVLPNFSLSRKVTWASVMHQRKLRTDQLLHAMSPRVSKPKHEVVRFCEKSTRGQHLVAWLRQEPERRAADLADRKAYTQELLREAVENINKQCAKIERSVAKQLRAFPIDAKSRRRSLKRDAIVKRVKMDLRQRKERFERAIQLLNEVNPELYLHDRATIKAYMEASWSAPDETTYMSYIRAIIGFKDFSRLTHSDQRVDKLSRPKASRASRQSRLSTCAEQPVSPSVLSTPSSPSESVFSLSSSQGSSTPPPTPTSNALPAAKLQEAPATPTPVAADPVVAELVIVMSALSIEEPVTAKVIVAETVATEPVAAELKVAQSLVAKSVAAEPLVAEPSVAAVLEEVVPSSSQSTHTGSSASQAMTLDQTAIDKTLVTVTIVDDSMPGDTTGFTSKTETLEFADLISTIDRKLPVVTADSATKSAISQLLYDCQGARIPRGEFNYELERLGPMEAFVNPELTKTTGEEMMQTKVKLVLETRKDLRGRLITELMKDYVHPKLLFTQDAVGKATAAYMLSNSKAGDDLLSPEAGRHPKLSLLSLDDRAVRLDFKMTNVRVPESARSKAPKEVEVLRLDATEGRLLIPLQRAFTEYTESLSGDAKDAWRNEFQDAMAEGDVVFDTKAHQQVLDLGRWMCGRREDKTLSPEELQFFKDLGVLFEYRYPYCNKFQVLTVELDGLFTGDLLAAPEVPLERSDDEDNISSDDLRLLQDIGASLSASS